MGVSNLVSSPLETNYVTPVIICNVPQTSSKINGMKDIGLKDESLLDKPTVKQVNITKLR